jgi:hypothetical protein
MALVHTGENEEFTSCGLLAFLCCFFGVVVVFEFLRHSRPFNENPSFARAVRLHSRLTAAPEEVKNEINSITMQI